MIVCHRREHLHRNRLRDRDHPARQRVRRGPRGLLRRAGRAVQNLPDPPAQPPIHVLDASRPDLEQRTRRADLRRAVADAPRLDRRRRLRGRPQRAVRPERSARLLRPVPAAPVTDAIHLHGSTRPGAMGNPPDEAARRVSPTRHSAAAPRRRIGCSGMRTNRARRRGRGLASPPRRRSIAEENPGRGRIGAVANVADARCTAPSRTGYWPSAGIRGDDPHRRRPDSAEAHAVEGGRPVAPDLVEASAQGYPTDGSLTAGAQGDVHNAGATRDGSVDEHARCPVRGAVTRSRPRSPANRCGRSPERTCCVRR